MTRSDIYHAHPELLGGTPVFTGTRVPVDSLVQHLRSGVTLDAFLDDFPSVRRDQAEAFLTLCEELAPLRADVERGLDELGRNEGAAWDLDAFLAEARQRSKSKPSR